MSRAKAVIHAAPIMSVLVENMYKGQKSRRPGEEAEKNRVCGTSCMMAAGSATNAVIAAPMLHRMVGFQLVLQASSC